MTSRVCATCRFYEPSGVWRQGWCRNPRLYGPQESHPVEAGSLDCESTESRSYWEPAFGLEPASENDSPTTKPRRDVAASAPVRRLENAGGSAMSAGPDRAGSSEERTVSYQPEERYWTDYLRIALPVIGLLLLIGLLWYWASALIGDGVNQPPPTPELAAVVTPVNEATPAPPTATAVVIAPTPGPPVAPTPTPVTPAPVATQPVAVPTTPPVTAEPENPCANMPVYPVGALVTTTAELNLRDGPSTDSNAVTVLPTGTQLQVTGDFSEAGQCDWWPVTATESGQSGWVIEEFLKPVAP